MAEDDHGGCEEQVAEPTPKKEKKKQLKGQPAKTTEGPDKGNKHLHQERPRRTSDLFDKFYQDNLVKSGLVCEQDWELFIDTLNRPLPTTLWITPTAGDAADVKRFLEQYQAKANTFRATGAPDGDSSQPLRVHPLSWMPDNMAWCVDVPKAVLRKDVSFKPLHRFLIWHTNRGTINRQEEVSMLPVALLGVQAGHRCLDMCAAPGSKTAQMLSFLGHANFTRWGRGLESKSSAKVLECHSQLHGRINYSRDEGFVIANDLSVDRMGMLVHQISRNQSLYPLAVFTSHDARFFPSIRTPEGSEIQFDRILCDVMCSGDGTLRKAPHLWREWHPKMSLELHPGQLAIALRAARLLKVGGRMVYSTCSMSPVENEAVVAELLRATRGALEVVDVRNSLAPFKVCEGLRKWRVAHPQTSHMYSAYAEAIAGESYDKRLIPGAFAPNESSSISAVLPRCIRILPHMNDTGGFFVAVLEKVSDVPQLSTSKTQESIPIGVETGSEHRCESCIDDLRAYDSEVDADGEEEERQRQLQKLENAIANGRSEQERTKAVARRERVERSGSLARELARYIPAMDAISDEVKSLMSFYGFDDEFPVHLLFCRYHIEMSNDGSDVQSHQGASNQLIFCAEGVAQLLSCGTGKHARRKLKVLTGGLRAFEKDRFEVSARDSQYRLGQEAVELLLPYLRRRVVALHDVADTRLLLNAQGKNAAIAALCSPESAEMQDWSPGGCILLLRAEDGQRVPVSALRTRHAINVYVNDVELPAVKKACGLVSALDEEVAEETAVPAEGCALPQHLTEAP